MSKLTRKEEATATAQDMLEALFDSGMTEPQIARRLEVCERTIRRARQGHHVLRFDTVLGLEDLLEQQIKTLEAKARITGGGG